jgi:hypothetical protein
MLSVIASEIIKKAISEGKNLEECRQELIYQAQRRGMQYPDDEMVIRLFHEVEEYNRYIVSERKKNTARPVFDRTRIWREFDSIDLETELPHWYRYQKSLKENGWSSEDIQSVQESSTDILDAIFEAEERKWIQGQGKPVKGLVLGYVQSGKTASMAGVMALAADRGYDMVIVLSGIHNALNTQTTRRFENDLWTYEKHGNNFGENARAQEYVQQLKTFRTSWYNITPRRDHIRAGDHPFVNLAKPIFGVFKKNVAVLNRLSTWITDNGRFFGNDFKLLIIDDECDQASPNTKDYTTGEESRINNALSNLIYNSHFPKVTYIGYTATPFAAILNEPPGHRSLYPEDFIHTLRKPQRHFGTEEVFGHDNSHDTPMAVIMKNSDDMDEELFMRTQLRKAIAYFICACASRNLLRSQKKYSTMLVHTSGRVLDHGSLASEIESVLDDYRRFPEKMKLECKEIWEEQRNRLGPDILSEIFGLPADEFNVTEPFDEISEKLPLVLSGSDNFLQLKVCVDNSNPGSYHRLDYPDLNINGNKPYPIIVIGGNTLSRGLTLEGLTVSFFMRMVDQMDTLLQMGRWFGYRRGYEDLVRVWTTDTTLGYFQHLSDVERDLRDQIESLYTNSGVSPDQVALTVKTHPSMRVVRKVAMQAATFKAVYFGTAPQTYYFKHKNYQWLQKNWNVANDLLSRLEFNELDYAATGPDEIIKFLSGINVHELHSEVMGPDFLINFIQKTNNNGHLRNWHVAVASRLRDDAINPNTLESYKYIVRTKLKTSAPGYPEDANIKTLRAPGDLFIDLKPDKNDPEEALISNTNSPVARMELLDHRQISAENRPGLLLLYPIKKHVEPDEITRTEREDLDAVHDVLGWSIVFPHATAPDMKDLYERVGIDLK